MKTQRHIFLITGMAVGSALAIEAPPDDAPPPMEVAPPAQEAPAAAPAVPEQVAFLGLVSGEVPEMLATHLGLQAGEGILVRSLMPDGPAAKSGLAVNDVITRIGDKPVAKPEDLTREVSARKPGEKVRVDVIHNGKPIGIDVTLGARPEELAALNPGGQDPLNQLNLDGVPRELADRVRRMIEGNLGDMRLDFEQGMQEAAPHLEDAMRDMRKRMEKAMQGFQMPEIPAMPQQGGIQIHQGATLRLMDDQGSIELKSIEGGKEVTVRDKEQKIVWTGPWDTEQDKAAAPEDIRQRVERLNFDVNGNGLRLQFRNGIHDP